MINITKYSYSKGHWVTGLSESSIASSDVWPGISLSWRSKDADSKADWTIGIVFKEQPTIHYLLNELAFVISCVQTVYEYTGLIKCNGLPNGLIEKWN